MGTKLTTNSMAILDILRIHLNLNEDQYLENSMSNANVTTRILKAKFFKDNALLESDGKINSSSRVLQVITKQLTNIYLSESGVLLKLFKYIIDNKNIVLPPTFFKEAADNTAKAM